MLTNNFWFSKRFLISVLVYLSHICNFCLVLNINIAIVEMTSSKTITIGNQTLTQPAEFDWDSRQKSWILSAQAFGGLSIVLVGHLALRYGGSTMITVGSFITCTSNLLNPFAARYNFYLYWFLRVLEGFSTSLHFVSVFELWSKWAPVQDRSKLVAIGFSGTYAGSTVSYFVCGFIIKNFGWPAVFYITGAVGLAWTSLWFLLVPNDPSSDKYISKQELTYITANRKETKPKKAMELWKHMLTSKVIFALCLAKFINDAGFTIVITCLPMYLKDITNAAIDKIGIYASIPNVVSMLTIPLCGYALDALQNSKLLTTTQAHKLFVGFGFVCSAIALFVTASFSSSFTISLTCLTLFKVMLSFSSTVIHTVAICIAPQSASVVGGLVGLFHFISAIVNRTMVGYIVTNHKASEWSLCFATVGVFLLVGALLYAIFGSSESQPWSYGDELEEYDKKPNQTEIVD